jgi:hypothetical protein
MREAIDPTFRIQMDWCWDSSWALLPTPARRRPDVALIGPMEASGGPSGKPLVRS